MMTVRAALLWFILILALSGVSALAQTPEEPLAPPTPRAITPTAVPSPTPQPTEEPDLGDLQEVVVDDWAYLVDPWFICQSFVIARITKLAPDVGIQTLITVQPFYRSGAEMLAGEAFTTIESEITEDVAVGETFVCTPQRPVEETP